MSSIEGKFKKIIYANNDSNYYVTLFRVIQSDDLKEHVGKMITVTGSFPNLQLDAKYQIRGDITNHPKYSTQFCAKEYELILPSSEEEMIEFLSSPFIEGCSKEMAKKIVDKFGTNALSIIKNDQDKLMEIKGMTALKVLKMHNSINNYDINDKVVSKLKEMGFTLEDISKILAKHQIDIETILSENLYLLKDLFDFKKIDQIYINNFDPFSKLRCKECILNSMIEISNNEGSTYYVVDDIYKALNALYNLNISKQEFTEYIDELINEGFVTKDGSFYYVTKYYEEEIFIAKKLHQMANVKQKKISNINTKIDELEKIFNVSYNVEQKKAILNSLEQNVSIISGGPGTGKTTIIKAITKIYIDHNKLDSNKIITDIALLAPTGRASKRLSMSTGLPGYTIHRFLKWHKDDNSFEYNEDNKISQKLVIVDEASMLDISLMKSLLSAMYDNTKLILVGDIYQLPSVGPGLILSDLINSDYFTFSPLNIIYRQSDNSYIPFLAKDIKNQNIDDEFMYKRDDYVFFACREDEILNKIKEVAIYGLGKGINDDNLQILAPMYKGDNGIDNLNKHLQNIYNPKNDDKNEITYGEKIYRENDKILQLMNDSEKGVYNGDIGKIIAIYKGKDNKYNVDADFDGNIVTYEKKELKNISHAYAITIHKSQGSEFEHVLMPICNKYYIMLYNKLLYTGVSRAKKSLTIVGDPRSFITAVQNNYASTRKTTLQERLKRYFNE